MPRPGAARRAWERPVTGQGAIVLLARNCISNFIKTYCRWQPPSGRWRPDRTGRLARVGRRPESVRRPSSPSVRDQFGDRVFGFGADSHLLFAPRHPCGIAAEPGPGLLGHLLPLAESLHVALMLDEPRVPGRSEEHTSELQSLMRISYAVFCLKK